MVVITIRLQQLTNEVESINRQLSIEKLIVQMAGFEFTSNLATFEDYIRDCFNFPIKLHIS